MAESMTNSSKSSTADLGVKPIGSLLMKYSLPAIVASLATSLYNIVDSIFIGRGVGAMAITGLAITFPLMNLVVAFCVLVAVGGATISSIFLGERNVAKASNVVGNVTILCLVHAAVITTIGLVFLDPILYFFGATEETITYAREFMAIILMATPVSYVFLGLNNLMRATGYPRKAMISALFSVGVNIAAAPVFIYFQSIGKPALSIFLSLTRQLIFLLPLLLIFARAWGVNGVWASMCGSDLLAFFLALITMIIMNRRLARSMAKHTYNA